MSRVDHFRDSDLLNLFERALAAGLDQTAIKSLDHPSCEVAKPTPKQNRLASYLSTSIRYGRLAVIRFLLYQKGANPNYKDNSSGFTAFGTAARYNQIEAARFLLDSGKYDGNAMSSERHNKAAKIAQKYGNIEFLTFMFPDRSPQPGDEAWFWTTRLLEAARDGEVEKVKKLSQGDVDLN